MVRGRDQGKEKTPNESRACGAIQMRSEPRTRTPPKMPILRRSRGVACLRVVVVGDLRAAAGAMAMFCVASIGVDPPRYLGGYAVRATGVPLVPLSCVSGYEGLTRANSQAGWLGCLRKGQNPVFRRHALIGIVLNE